MKQAFLIISLLMTGMSTAPANESPEALQDAFMAALRSHDAAGIAACYSEDAVNFAVGALMEHGPEEVEASWNGFFEANRVLEITLSDKHMETHGDTAIAWGLFTMRVEPAAGGEPAVMEGRYMDVARNFDGRWLYVADHASLPLPEEENSGSE